MSDRITVIHAPHESERGYFALSRDVPQDKRLSFEARGVLCYLLSKPNDWIVRVQDIQNAVGKVGKKEGLGRDRVYRILGELRDCGYLHRDRIRKSDGTFEWGPYRVYEKPFTENQEMDIPHTKAVQPLTENPDTGKPYTGYPDTENQEVVKRGIKHQKAKRPFPEKPYPENQEIIHIIDTTDQRSLESRERTTKSTPAPFFEALADVCCVTLTLATQKQRSDLGSTAAKLSASGATVEQLIGFKSWWFSDSNWRTRKATEAGRKPEAPKPAQVLEEWGNALAMPVVSASLPIKPVDNRPTLPVVQANPNRPDPAESRRATAEAARQARGAR